MQNPIISLPVKIVRCHCFSLWTGHLHYNSDLFGFRRDASSWIDTVKDKLIQAQLYISTTETSNKGITMCMCWYSVKEKNMKKAQDSDLSWLNRKRQFQCRVKKQIRHQRPSPATSCNHNSLLTEQSILRSLNSSNLSTATGPEHIWYMSTISLIVFTLKTSFPIYFAIYVWFP